MLSKIKRFMIIGFTALFLFSSVGCATLGIGIERNDTTEFVIKQVGRGLGYKVSNQNPDSICEVKSIAEQFIATCNSSEYSDEGATAFANMAVSYVMGEVNLEDPMLQKSLEDLADYIKLDMGNVQIDEDNLELLKIAIISYLEGLDMAKEEKSITCELQ